MGIGGKDWTWKKKLRSGYEGKVRIGGEGNEKKMGPGSEGKMEMGGKFCTWKKERSGCEGKVRRIKGSERKGKEKNVIWERRENEKGGKDRVGKRRKWDLGANGGWREDADEKCLA